ncbi:Dabb family protein [Nocardia pseudovaccinii]|uniref:Dabb family protein n=1 Tax=Nocardia pseudovaccinii TaxID=189540 RepID=UPI003D9392EC
MTRWFIRTPVDNGVVLPEAGTSSVRVCSAGPDLPGSVGGLGMTCDLTADVEPWRALPGLPTSADIVALRPVASQQVTLSGPRVKRTLLLRVRPGTPEHTVTRFEADLTAMPRHIRTIHSWALSRTDAAAGWTHAWEQEFADPDGLNGEYLLHPYHWTCVDRWFDAEIPDAIVEPAIAHIFRWADNPILG